MSNFKHKRHSRIMHEIKVKSLKGVRREEGDRLLPKTETENSSLDPGSYCSSAVFKLRNFPEQCPFQLQEQESKLAWLLLSYCPLLVWQCGAITFIFFLHTSQT